MTISRASLERAYDWEKLSVYNQFSIEVKSLATAFVLLNAETGLENEVMKGLKEIKEVKEAHLVYGTYDIIARIDTDIMQELKEVVNWKIRRLEKVRSTLTMIVI